MSSNTTYLITGANRGLGLELTQTFLSRPTTTVIAGVRNPSNSASVASLNALPIGAGSKLITVKIDSVSETDATDAVKFLGAEHGITALDIVIANSGIADCWDSALKTPIQEMRNHFEVNTIGPLVLFQAVASLLEASGDGKFFVMGSSLGSIANMEDWPMPSTAYGTSKAAINFITRKIHFENPKLTAVALHPGWVATDMGDSAAATFGVPGPALTAKVSMAGIVKRIDTATREETSGTFATYDRNPLAW